MARKDRKAHKEDRIDRARKRIWGAHRRLERSLFGPLLGNVHLQWCEGKEGDPLLACVDPGQGVIWVNPHRRPELDEAEWTFILGHELVHLGLNHGPRRQERDPMLWNLACDHAADNFLHAFKLGRPPHDFPVDTTLAGKREEEIYEFLAGERQCRTELKTLAGPGCLDIVRRPCVLSRYGVDRRRRDYEKLLAEGIRRAVDDAVVEAAEALGQAETRPGIWPPAEKARRWVMNEFPLLGALAQEVRIIADASLCERMDISIAAVDGFLGEMYLHPGWKLTEEELIFVYVHELLHVALLHHTRSRGRDPWLYNVACFPAGTWTGFGKPIESVATVQRHFTGDLVELDCQAGPVRCTPEHPFLIRRRRGKTYPIAVTDPEWVEAREVRPSDYLLVPQLREKGATEQLDLRPYTRQGIDSKGRRSIGNRALRQILLDPETAWMIGLYVAEGSSSPIPKWSLGKHETALVERLRQIARRIGCSSCVTAAHEHSLAVFFGSRVLGRWLKDHCGGSAGEKRVPQCILRHADPAIRAAFLDGLLAGDGHIRRQSSCNQSVAILGSVSERLIADVILLLAQDGNGASRRVMHRGARWIGGFWTDRPLVLHLLSWNPAGSAVTERVLNGKTILSHSHSWRSDNHGVWYPVRSVSSQPFEGLVYNLSTPDHTYIANGYLVHNCDFIINGWLVEMGVGKLPSIGALYDPRLQGRSAEEVYDLLACDRRRCRGLRGFRGGLGDVLLDSPGRRIYRGDVTTLDDLYRRCMAAGFSTCQGRGTIPAGLLEEIRSLFTPPVPWDVELGRWMEQHVPIVREKRRTYARASRRQSSTPDIPRPARYVPQEWQDACTFGVILDTSGSMDRELLGRALGAIASYAEAREVPAVRLVLCDAAPYDQGIVAPTNLRGIFPIRGRGGTVLQPAVSYLVSRPDFPSAAPVMIITDGWCEEELLVPREHCFVLPRKSWKEGAIPLRTSAPMFRVLKEEYYGE